jgi:hypothetical protein
MNRSLMPFAVGLMALTLASPIFAQDSLLTSPLPGEFEVRRASARPATRAMQLLYACAMDDYITVHKEALERLPPALRSITDRKDTAIYAFRNYKLQYPNDSPDDNAQQIQNDLTKLRRFRDSGYRGAYAKELEEFIKALEAKV